LRKLCAAVIFPALIAALFSGCSRSTPRYTLKEMHEAFLLPDAAIVSSSRGVIGEMFTYTLKLPFSEVCEQLSGTVRELGIRKTEGTSDEGLWRFEGWYGDAGAPSEFLLSVKDVSVSGDSKSEVSVKYGTGERENFYLQPVGNREAEAALIPEPSSIVYINAGRIELESPLTLAELTAFYTAALEGDLDMPYYSLAPHDLYEGFVIRSTYLTGTDPDPSVSHLYQYDRMSITAFGRDDLRHILIRYPAAIGPDSGAPTRTRDELAGLFAPPPGSKQVTWLQYSFPGGYDADSMKEWYLGMLAQNGFIVLDVSPGPDAFLLRISGTYGAREYFAVHLSGDSVRLSFTMYE